jgi:hypothetical protein
MSLAGRSELHEEAGRVAPMRSPPIPWGLAGMLILVVAIECVIGRHWLQFSDPVSLSWRYSAQAAQADAPRSELLCLGDSLVKHGLVPAVIEQGTGRRTVNLSAARCPALMTYFLLRRSLDAGAKPRAIIVNAKPAVLLANPEFNIRYWQEVLTPRECADMLFVSRRARLVVDLVTGRLLPSLRCRLQVRSSLAAALEGRPDPVQALNRVLWRNWTHNSGANISTADSSAGGKSALEVARRNRADVFHVDRTNVVAIERLLQLAAERNIPVFWLLTPLAPELQEFRDSSGAEAGYERFIHSLQARFPQIVTVLDARRATYPAALFADPTHLNGRGAIALSQEVAREIGRALEHQGSGAEASAGWITLNAPVDHPSALGIELEDLERSREIVELDKAAWVRRDHSP